MMEFRHESVMLRECVEALHIRPEGTYVDGTLGGGGHAAMIAEKLTSGGRLIGIDRDAEAVEAAKERLSPFADRVTVVKDNFANFRSILAKLDIESADGILLDLGVSSHQIDDPGRGFSYRMDGPLDMRMDTDETENAADLVNTADRETLTRILREYGEERYAGRIAAAITERRKTGLIESTGELSDLICRAVPSSYARTGGHPAKRTFQALRIAVNEELTVLSDTLPDMIDALSPGGRLVVISFHSLEDRIVKNAMRTAENPCTCPPDLPVCVCGKRPKGKVISRKPVLPGEEETARNPRASSAKVRVFERF